MLSRIIFVSKRLTLLYYYLYWYRTEHTPEHTVISKIVNHIQTFLLLCQATVILKLSYTAVFCSHKFHYEFHNKASFNSQEFFRSVSLETISLQRQKERQKERQRWKDRKRERQSTVTNSIISVSPLSANWHKNIADQSCFICSLILTLRYNTDGCDFFKFHVKPREYITEYRNNFYHLKCAQQSKSSTIKTP